MALNDAGYSKNVLEKLPESQKDRMVICSPVLLIFQAHALEAEPLHKGLSERH